MDEERTSSETCCEQLLRRDDKHFRKFIDNTTTHGVVKIFTGKSIIRRLFCLVFVLGATAGCLYNVIDRIIYFAGQPTSTTISVIRQPSLTFPAVTVCNLNEFQRESVENIHPDLSRVLRNVYYTDPTISNDTEDCKNYVDYFVATSNFTSLRLSTLTINGAQPREEFILSCLFAGKACNMSQIIPMFTQLGVCYTFNPDPANSILSRSTGTRSGLSLILNIDQSQYVSSSSLDAGVKVAIHPQTEPPRPDDIGIGVPPGRNAFIAIRQRNIVDNTKKNCSESTDISQFNFLNTVYNYSISSCQLDCLLSTLYKVCNCSVYPSNNPAFQDLPECTLSDICCVVQQYKTSPYCECPNACSAKFYDQFSSYSAFPAQYAISELQPLLNYAFNTSFDFERDFLSVNVYFDTLNIETETTSDAYGPVALLSDIGGQLGLFLGISIISIMEFATWIVDEVKSRVFGNMLREDKICSCCKKVVVEDDIELRDSTVKIDCS